MTRSLSSALQTELGNAVTTPAYFAEILFSSPVRFSSRGTIDWSGNTWISRDLAIRGLRYDAASPQQGGDLVVGDPDGGMMALILREGVSGRTVNVWKFYGTAPDPGDPVQVFAGAADSCAMDERSGAVTIKLVQRSVRELFAPRRYMTRAAGFSILPVIGRVVAFNGENFRLERYRG